MGQLLKAIAVSALLAACAPHAGGSRATAADAVEAAAAAEDAPDAKSLAMQIEAVEKALGQAVVRKDRAELERLLAPEFVLVGRSTGSTTTRADWLANLQRMNVQGMAVRVTGVTLQGDAALAQVEGEWTVSMGGAPATDGFQLEDTWVRRDGAWRIVRRVRLDAPGPRPPGG